MSHESCKHCAVQWKINIAPFMFVWDSKKSHIWQFMCCATFEDWHIYLSKVNLFYCVHSSYSVTLAFSQRKSSLIDGTMVCVWAKRFTIRQKMPCILNFTDYCTFLVFFSVIQKTSISLVFMWPCCAWPSKYTPMLVATWNRQFWRMHHATCQFSWSCMSRLQKIKIDIPIHQN